jgi:hypothetical protein
MSDTPPEAFTAVTTLIALIGDPKGCAKRMAELQKLSDQVAKAQAELGADRSAHDRFRVGGGTPMSIFGPPSDDPFIRAAMMRALRDAPPFVPGPDPLVKPEDVQEAHDLRAAGRLN